jgi:NAD(P)-dependent dehydrogenase (short-subunit alcohol dehydrogenase family)
VTRLARLVAVVTGASRGIGAATAELLASEGAQVIRVARSLSAGSHGSFHDVPCDLTDPAQVNRLGVRIVTQHGAPDIVVSNAGSFLLRPLEETDPAEFQQQLAVNLVAPFHVARAFLPAMRDAGKGSFISMGSIADHVGFPENAAYAASKFGLRGLHETLVAEYRGSGVRLTLISPGPTDTEMWDGVDLEQRPELTPRTRMLRPNDVAEAVLFVATRPPNVLIDWLRLGPAGNA